MDKRPKARTTVARPITGARTPKSAKAKSSERKDSLAGGSESEDGDLPTRRGDSGYWEKFDLPAEELQRLGYSNEYDDPVVGLSGVRPDSPVDARRILESFVERVRTGERLPWAMVRYLACAFEQMISGGVNPDESNNAAKALGLHYIVGPEKKKDRHLGKKMRIGTFVFENAQEEQRKGTRNPLDAAVNAAADKFKVGIEVAKDYYLYVIEFRRRNGIPVPRMSRIRKRP